MNSTGPNALTAQIDPGGETLAAVAQLHRAELPGSLISRMGHAYSAAFYDFAATSALEFVVAQTGDGGIVLGGGFVSFSPADLTRRMMAKTPLVRALVVRPGMAASLVWREIQSCGRSPDTNPKNDPELIALFVRRDCRSRGIGALLLRDIEEVLRGQNKSRYLIRTLDRPDNRAVKFYESAGFATLSSVVLHGERFRIMAKQI